jgi:hypothetical protein
VESLEKPLLKKTLQINLENSLNGLGLKIFTKYSFIVLGDFKLYKLDHYSLQPRFSTQTNGVDEFESFEVTILQI